MKKLTKIIAALFIPLIFSGCGAMNKSLHIPAAEGDLDKVRAEIEGGRTVDSKDIAGQTALMYAAETGRMQVLEYLVSKGADVNAKSGNLHNTSLMYAAAANRLEAIEFLIARGANVDAVNSWKQSALIFAAYKGNADAIKLLLENGAHANLKNKDGETALDIARKRNHHDSVQLLESL